MARERRNAPVTDNPTRRRPLDSMSSTGNRPRRRGEEPELELSDEEVLALADEGLDPDEIRRVALERREAQEASDHDRDTARDELEGLVAEQEEGY